jgi:hypothetical protein
VVTVKVEHDGGPKEERPDMPEVLTTALSVLFAIGLVCFAILLLLANVWAIIKPAIHARAKRSPSARHREAQARAATRSPGG